MFFEEKIIISIMLIGIIVSEILLKIDEDNMIKIILINDNINMIIEIESNINIDDIMIYFILFNNNKNNNIIDIIIINFSGFLNFIVKKQINVIGNNSFIKGY